MLQPPPSQVKLGSAVNRSGGREKEPHKKRKLRLLIVLEWQRTNVADIPRPFTVRMMESFVDVADVLALDNSVILKSLENRHL